MIRTPEVIRHHCPNRINDMTFHDDWLHIARMTRACAYTSLYRTNVIKRHGQAFGNPQGLNHSRPFSGKNRRNCRLRALWDAGRGW